MGACEAAGKRRPGAQERPEPAGAAAVAQLARSARGTCARARQSSPFLGLIGARFEEDHEEGDDEHLRVAGVVVAGLDEPLAREGDGRQKFFLLRTRTSERQRAEGHCVSLHPLWPRAPGRPERASPREATSAPGAGGSAASEPQVCPSTYPPSWTCSCPTSPGRLGVPRATRATRWPPPRRRRPARPAAAPSPGPSSPRALRPPSSANMYRFHASGAKATRHPSINDAERKRLSNASRFSLGLGLGKSIFQWTISPPMCMWQ